MSPLLSTLAALREAERHAVTALAFLDLSRSSAPLSGEERRVYAREALLVSGRAIASITDVRDDVPAGERRAAQVLFTRAWRIQRDAEEALASFKATPARVVVGRAWLRPVPAGWRGAPANEVAA